MNPQGSESNRVKPRVVYTSKEELYPLFGKAIPQAQVAYVRKDLPHRLKEFVKEHELYHLGDKAACWYWREIKANTFGALKHPLGFALCLLLSLTLSRLRYYAGRIRRFE
jgi:hypothetical protein